MNVKCVPNDMSVMYTQPKQTNRTKNKENRNQKKQKTKTTNYDKLLNKLILGKLSQDYEMHAVCFCHITGGSAGIKLQETLP